MLVSFRLILVKVSFTQLWLDTVGRAIETYGFILRNLPYTSTFPLGLPHNILFYSLVLLNLDM